LDKPEKFKNPNKSNNSSLTEKLINSSSSILYDSKNFDLNETYYDGSNSKNSKKNKIKNETKKGTPNPDSKESNEKKKKISTNSSQQSENKKIQKPNPIKGEDFYNIKPLNQNSKISPITLSKNSSFNFNEQVKNTDKVKKENKNDLKKNSERILENIKSEYDIVSKKSNSNIYNHNKENLNLVGRDDENYYENESNLNSFFKDKNKSQSNFDKLDKALNRKNSKPRKVKKENVSNNLDYDDFPNYHFLENYQSDIAFDDADLNRILEISKYEK